MACASRLGAIAVVAFGLLVAAAAQADERATSGCALGPIGDAQVAQARIAGWAKATKLPAFDKDRSQLSIDRSSVRLTLRFASGELTVSWVLDDACRPHAIAIRASTDYVGVRPGEVAVRRLAAELAAVAAPRPVAQPYVPGRKSTGLAARDWWGVGAAMVALGLLWLTRRIWSPLVRASWAHGVRLAHALWSGVRAAARALWARLVAMAGVGWSTAVAIAWRMRRAPATSWVRWVGVVAIVPLLPYGVSWSGSGHEGRIALNVLVLAGVFLITAFLWLVATGTFGWASPRRADWPALVPFLLALGIREGIARHAIGDNEIYFFHGVFRHRHSVVHPLLQMFLQPLARDPYAWMMHVNGVLGALATLPLFLLVRRRTDSELTALLVAVFFAVHPIIVQMAPTDLPYSLLLFTWFAGLALWSTESIGAREIFGGSVLLGIAATCRIEGGLYLVASLMLLDLRALWSAVRAHRVAAALGASTLLALVAVHAYFCLPTHILPGEPSPVATPEIWGVLRAGLLPYDYSHPLFVVLIVTGVVAGIRDARMRIGFGAGLGALLVVALFADSTNAASFLARHRLVPTCALQTIAAGVGASWLLTSFSLENWSRWTRAVPGLGVALLMFLEQLHEIRTPNALTDEFWMLRKQLAPAGEVKAGCALLSLGSTMDTDICDFAQVLPGMPFVRCEQQDCVSAASRGGCFYYLRSLNCFFHEGGTPLACGARGRTASGDLAPCMDPRCVRIERELGLSLVEERHVDVHAAFPYINFPRTADIGLYRVVSAER